MGNYPKHSQKSHKGFPQKIFSQKLLSGGFSPKGFPKEFNDETEMNNDGFPCYQRRQIPWDAHSEEMQKKLTKYTQNEFGQPEKDFIDNRHIVSYNKHLSLLFNCHLNVEYCGTVGAVKYLYK